MVKISFVFFFEGSGGGGGGLILSGTNPLRFHYFGHPPLQETYKSFRKWYKRFIFQYYKAYNSKEKDWECATELEYIYKYCPKDKQNCDICLYTLKMYLFRNPQKRTNYRRFGGFNTFGLVREAAKKGNCFSGQSAKIEKGVAH